MIVLILFMILFGGVANAAEPEASLADVLYWKYGPGASTCQSEKDLSPRICGWKIAQPQPSEAEIVVITEQYKLAKIAENVVKKDKKDASLAKLKITEQEFKDILNGLEK